MIEMTRSFTVIGNLIIGRITRVFTLVVLCNSVSVLHRFQDRLYRPRKIDATTRPALCLIGFSGSPPCLTFAYWQMSVICGDDTII